MITGLSEIEKEFLGIVNELGCMSRYEAELILHRYFNCTEGMRYKILRHLTREYYIDVTTDEKFIVSGNRKRNNANNVSKAIVVALHVALDQIHKDKELYTTSVRYIYKDPSGAIGFISRNKLYKIYVLSPDNIYTIRIIEDMYGTKHKRLNKDKYANGLNFSETSIFVFTDIKRTDEILEKIEEMELTIPHRIVITHKADVSGAISYDNYDLSAEE